MADTPRTNKCYMVEELRENSEQLETELAEAQADADHWKGECNALQRMVHEARAEIERLKCCGNCALKSLTAIPNILTHPYRDFCAVCKDRSMWHSTIESAIKAKGGK